MADTSSSLSLPFILPNQAQKHVTHNEALRILDVVTQLGVAADDLTTPPLSPAEGTRYILDTGGTGEWAGHDTEIALFETGAWRFFVPRAGWRAYVINRDAMVVYDGAEWVDLESPELEDLDTLGLGMTTLPDTPFTAKLNAALWTALYVADNGTGNLVQTLNKEATANDAGFVFQQDFQTRGLFGLFGNDNLRLTTSPDGTTFYDGLIVQSATGIVDQPTLPRFKGTTNYDNYADADVWNRIGINTLEYNDQNSFDAATNLFTAPVAGTYMFGSLLTFKRDNSVSCRMAAQFVRNGTDPIIGSQVEQSSVHVSERTSLELHTMAVLAPGDTVELQGMMRVDPGIFMADRCDFWGYKIG